MRKLDWVASRNTSSRAYTSTFLSSNTVKYKYQLILGFSRLALHPRPDKQLSLHNISFGKDICTVQPTDVADLVTMA